MANEPKQQLELSEFFCPYCSEWTDAFDCQSHFYFAHHQQDVTLEKLKSRLAMIGGLEVRPKPGKVRVDDWWT